MADTFTTRQLRDALQLDVDKLDGERAQANLVAKLLAKMGHRTPAEVKAGKMDGSVLRLYLWPGSPLGDLILATGAAFKPRILSADEITEQRPGIYILAANDTTKARESVARTAERYREPTPRAPRAPRAPLPPKTAERVRKAVAPIREQLEDVQAPSVAHLDAEKRARVMDFLTTLLG